MTQHVLVLNSFLTKSISEAIFAFNTTINNAMVSYRRAQNYKKTVKELSNLTDRELLDMGISRYDIEHIAKEASK